MLDIGTPARASTVFAAHAPRMRAAGFAVIPSHGKEPLRKGFSNWKRAPGPAAVEKWAARDPDADIVYVPGLSRTRRRREVIVIDADDMDAVGRCAELFGDTPGRLNTRRGQHRLYEGDGRDLGKLSSLRKFGINADIKHGQKGAGIVVAPPSRHAEDRSFAYSWDRCDETVINDLPPFRYAALQALIGETRPESKQPVSKVEINDALLREGSRKLTLNDWLYGQAWSFSSENEMLGAAFVRNKEIGSLDPRGPLEPDEVMDVVKVVWRDREAGKIEKLAGTVSRAKRHRQELDWLASIKAKTAPDAYVLLHVLRDEHSERCRRGETFALSVHAMARAEVIPGWSWWRYDRARDLLLKAGLIEKVTNYIETADGRLCAQYILSCCLPTGGGARGGQE